MTSPTWNLFQSYQLALPAPVVQVVWERVVGELDHTVQDVDTVERDSEIVR